MGATFLPSVRQKISSNLLVVGATVLFAGVTAVLAHVHIPAVAGGAMVFGGIAWMAVMSSFKTSKTQIGFRQSTNFLQTAHV